MRGEKEVKIRSAGTDLVLVIGGERCLIRPGVGAVLRCQSALEQIADVGTTLGQAELAEAMLEHLTGEHRDRIAELRVEEQTQVVHELYEWFMGEPVEAEGDDGPLGASSVSRGGSGAVLTMSSDGTPAASSTSSALLDPYSLPSDSDSPRP